VARPRLGRLTGGGRLAAAVALIVAIIVVVVIVVNASSGPSAGTAAGAATGSGAATVQRRNLTETDTESGTLSYSNPQTVYNRLGGTITWLPAVGDEVKPGQTLYKVDGQPVVLMSGDTPVYRTLSPGISDGPDVLQLNRNLVRLGFNADGITVDDVWQPGTTLGVEQFQESLGQAPTGTLSLGQIVFLPGPQLISTVDGTLGAGSGSSNASASTTVGAPQPEFVSLQTCPPPTGPGSTGTTTTGTTSTGTSPCTTTTSGAKTRPKKHHHHKSGHSRQTLAALLALLRAEVAQLRAEHSSAHGNSGKSSSSRSSSSKNSTNDAGSSSGSGGGSNGSGGGSSGSGGGSSGGQAILQTTSTQLVVTVNLDASLQSEATVGEHVMVEMPSNQQVEGKVTAVSTVAQSSSNSGNGNSGGGGSSGGGNANGSGNGSSSSTIPVTITLKGHQRTAGLDQAAVSVNFIKQRAANVLSVPVTALLATSGTSYAVQEAVAPHKLIPVITGLFAAGYVQVSGSGIYPGLQVTDSQG
jgi:hypothetical protein